MAAPGQGLHGLGTGRADDGRDLGDGAGTVVAAAALPGGGAPAAGRVGEGPRRLLGVAGEGPRQDRGRTVGDEQAETTAGPEHARSGRQRPGRVVDDLVRAGVPQGPEIGRRLQQALARKLDDGLATREDELAAALGSER